MGRFLCAASIVVLALAGCAEPEDEATTDAEGAEDVVVEDAPAPAPEWNEATIAEALAGAISSDARTEAAKARDVARNPAETISFFGVKPTDTVVEIWPGAGWYTDILSVYLAAGGGKLYAASFDPSSDNPRIQQAIESFDAKYLADPELYGDVERTVLARDVQEIAPPGSADAVLTFRNVHNFEMGGWSAEAFAAFYEALKPGGTLGIVEHRLPEDADKAREKTSGYVKVSTVRQLAEDTGFVFDGSSEINANPADNTDHPFGVWTLPPNSRVSDRDGNAPEGFDPSVYLEIGESDRMTLRFKKPFEPEEALLE
ncbi:MAG: hypothetical protein AAGH41_07210 [Pseudomonadota bacterium]